jgi:hypothetical protein
MTTLFGALSGSTAFPAFFLWPPSFFSGFLTFSQAPTFLRPLYFSGHYIFSAPTFLRPLHFSSSYISPATTPYTSPAPTFLWPLHFLQPLHFPGPYNPAPAFLWPLLFSGPFSSLASSLLWPPPLSGPFPSLFSQPLYSPAGRQARAPTTSILIVIASRRPTDCWEHCACVRS